MELAELILKYIQTLVYPVLIGFCVLFFRKEISGILRGDFKAKYKDLELTIERNRRILENIEDTHQVAITKMRDNLDTLESKPNQTAVFNLKFLLGAIEEALNFWESEVMRLLRKNNGRYSEEGLIDYYFQVETDPWRKNDEEKDLRGAIKSLVEKSVLQRVDGYLVMHPLLINKE